MKKYVLVFLGVLSLFAGVNLSQAKESDIELAAKLNGGTFIYTKNVDAFISFQDGKVAGNTGLNQFMGNYAVKDGRLILSAVGMTRKAGSEEDMNLEMELVKMLSNTPKIKFKKDNLLYLNRYRFAK